MPHSNLKFAWRYHSGFDSDPRIKIWDLFEQMQIHEGNSTRSHRERWVFLTHDCGNYNVLLFHWATTISILKKPPFRETGIHLRINKSLTEYKLFSYVSCQAQKLYSFVFFCFWQLLTRKRGSRHNFEGRGRRGKEYHATPTIEEHGVVYSGWMKRDLAEVFQVFGEQVHLPLASHVQSAFAVDDWLRESRELAVTWQGGSKLRTGYELACPSIITVDM